MNSTLESSGLREVRSAVRSKLRREGLAVPVGASGFDMLELLEGRSMKSEGIAMLEALVCVEASNSARTGVREKMVERLNAAEPVLNGLQAYLESSRPQLHRYVRAGVQPHGATRRAFFSPSWSQVIFRAMEPPERGWH